MGFFYSQLFVTPTDPKYSFANQTVIVTGSNTGLGLEAARHLSRLGAKKVILAVRNLTAGEAAKKDIEKTTERPGVCEVWHLDMASSESVKSFATKAGQLDRLDVLLENAGIAPFYAFNKAEHNEASVTVNVINTFLLALLLLPKLEETAQKFNTRPRLTIVASDVHTWAKFTERSAPNILARLAEPDTDMNDRYNVTKLLEILVIRHIAPLIAQGKNKDVILNTLTPGFCHSTLTKEAAGLQFLIVNIMKLLLARTTEVGGRTLVHAAGAGPESHGMYMYDGVVNEDEVAGWVKTEEGKQLGARFWGELKEQLESISPGVTKSVE